MARFDVPILDKVSKAIPSIGHLSPRLRPVTGPNGKIEMTSPGSAGTQIVGGATNKISVCAIRIQGRCACTAKMCNAANWWSSRPPRKPTPITNGASIWRRALSKSVVSCSLILICRSGGICERVSAEIESISPIMALSGMLARRANSAPPSAAIQTGAIFSASESCEISASPPPIRVTGSELATMRSFNVFTPAFGNRPQ